ncbi:MAG: J domain-containing protein [Methylococcaceae bacterium]|jgi:DnaJ-class molecular chaperone
MFEILLAITVLFTIYSLIYVFKNPILKKEKVSKNHTKDKKTKSPVKETPIRNHYANLKVSKDAPSSVIKAAYKALCQTYHPDKFQGSSSEAERIMKLINTSYAVLINPTLRAEHDAWIDKQ